MKTTIYIFLVLVIVIAAIFGILLVTDSITKEQFNDYASKAGLVLIILFAASALIQLIMGRKNNT